jgi:hypothetical protein
MGGMQAGWVSFGDQFRADDADVAGRLDAQANLAGLDPDHRDADVIADEQPLQQFAGQYEHVGVSPRAS